MRVFIYRNVLSAITKHHNLLIFVSNLPVCGNKQLFFSFLLTWHAYKRTTKSCDSKSENDNGSGESDEPAHGDNRFWQFKKRCAGKFFPFLWTNGKITSKDVVICSNMQVRLGHELPEGTRAPHYVDVFVWLGEISFSPISVVLGSVRLKGPYFEVMIFHSGLQSSCFARLTIQNSLEISRKQRI